MAPNPEFKLDPKYDDYDFPYTHPDAPSGHAGHTTPEQDAKVHQLRSMLEQAGYKERLDTLTMVRFVYTAPTREKTTASADWIYAL